MQDLGTYGIGIFTPTILATVIGASIEHPRNTAELIQSDILATRGAALIDVLLIVGIVCAVLLADRVGQRAALCRLHAVQLHDQYRSQRHDLSDRR